MRTTLVADNIAKPGGETGRFKVRAAEFGRRIANGAKDIFTRASILGSMALDKIEPARVKWRDERASAEGGRNENVPAILRKNDRLFGISWVNESVSTPSGMHDLTVPAIERQMAIMTGDIYAPGIGPAEREIIYDTPAIKRRNVPNVLLGSKNSFDRPWKQVFTLEGQKLAVVKERLSKFPQVAIAYRQGTPKDPHIVEVAGRPKMYLTTAKLKRLADVLKLEERIANFKQIKVLSGHINPIERFGCHTVQVSTGAKMILTTVQLGRLVEEFELQHIRNWNESQERKSRRQ